MRRPPTSSWCPARAALAGNPSDIHGGAVVAVPVRSVGASVTIHSSAAFRIAGFDAAPRSLADLDRAVDEVGCGTEQPLVVATLVALRRAFSIEIDPVRVDVDTTIPRNVGLAGSSAIVIATTRALAEHHRDRSWASDLSKNPALLASIALDAETSILGIAAGPQDRVVQALDHLVHMDFAGWSPGLDGGPARWRRLGDLPGVCFVACRPDHATESGEVHRRDPTSDGGIETATGELALLAGAAASAIDRGDVDALGASMRATFEVRARHLPLLPAHVEMIDHAHRAGAAANYTGSGGAISVLTADEKQAERLARSLVSDLGCRILTLDDAGAVTR